MKRAVLPIFAVALSGCLGMVQSVASQATRDVTDATHRLVTAATAPQQQNQQAAPQQQPQAQPVAVPAVAKGPERLPLKGKLAVLELRVLTKELSKENAQYFTDVIRQATLKMQPGLDVMTRENLLVLLESSGKKLDECEGECEVDTGRRIGADNVVSGELQKVGTKYKLSLKLHDTHAGRLLGTSIASGASVDELDTSLQQAAEALYLTK